MPEAQLTNNSLTRKATESAKAAEMIPHCLLRGRREERREDGRETLSTPVPSLERASLTSVAVLYPWCQPKAAETTLVFNRSGGLSNGFVYTMTGYW